MPKQSKNDNLVKLTDEKGRDHEFQVLEFFAAGKTPFAVLQPTKGPKNEVTILKVVLDKGGVPTAFKAPTDKEFQKAIEALDEADCGCGCGEGESEGCGCGEGGGCCSEGGCGCEGHDEAPKASAKSRKPAATKARAKKTPAKKTAKASARR